MALADSAGALQTQYTYEPYGAATVTGQANTNSFRYTGREDDGTGLYFYRARYYSPRLQRFISEDPLNILSGDANPYVYVGNSPLDFADPFGLRRLTDCEKKKLAPYIPKADLERADLHDDKWPPPVWWKRFISEDVIGITLENNIYFRPSAYDPGSNVGIALLGHELFHVGQYRTGVLTRFKYFREGIWRGGGEKNKYEKPAYELEREIKRKLDESGDKCKCTKP